ncbi:MAG: TIGR01777 family oxidoreductase [Bacteroidetes bacterium]|nr:TIGR01777 family oxidoreductase [Bacteroidota bacterium]
MAVIMVTGATGMLGRQLVQNLRQSGNDVRILTTNINKKDEKGAAFLWNVRDHFVQQGALDGVDVIIHLAGSNIGKKRWTAKNRQNIIESRSESADLLRETLEKGGHKIRHFISISATGYYPDPGSKMYTESDLPGEGFLSKVCMEWEKAALRFENPNTKVAIIRMAPVFSATAGLLPTISMTKGIRILPVLGSGKNIWAWIHIQDAVNIFQFILDHHLSGIYNANAPQITSQKEVLHAISGNQWIWHAPVPEFLLKLFLGERSALPLTNQKVSSEKLQKLGFIYQFPEINSAISNLFHAK